MRSGAYIVGRERRAISRSAASRGSSMPASRMNRLLGTQNIAAAFRVVPPVLAAFSSMTTEAPAAAAVTAAVKPAAPLPATTTSNSASHFSLGLRSGIPLLLAECVIRRFTADFLIVQSRKSLVNLNIDKYLDWRDLSEEGG